MKNMPLILEYLNIPADEVSNYGPFFRQSTRGEHASEGLQIDILITRKRQLLTLIECKYSDLPIGKGIIGEVEKK